MQRSTRRLSDVARRLVIPTGIVTTGWPAVAYWLRRLGIVFDPWQQGIAQLALGKRADGTYACAVGGVHLSIPRQVGKTYMIAGLVYALCLIYPGMTVIWTAHRTRTTTETYRSMRGMTRRQQISPYVDKAPKNNDEWGIFFVNGSRILFGARESGFGRGFAQVDLLICDEEQILTDKALDDMLPAMNASRLPTGGLLIGMGTPPRPTDPSEVFVRTREEALSGESADTLWVEFAPVDPVDPVGWARGYVDWEAFAQANPSFPDRTPRTSILRMVTRLSRESLRREGLGVWDTRYVARAIVTPAQWDACAVTEAPPGPPAYGVRFSADGREAAVSAAVLDGDRVHVEVLAVVPADDLSLDDRPLAQWIAARFSRCTAIVIDGRAGAGALLADLEKLGVRGHKVIAPTAEQAITAYAQTIQSVIGGTLTHGNQAGLNQASRVATRRPIGKTGGWGLRAVDGSSVTNLESAAMAAYGARQRPPVTTSRKIRVML